MNPIFIADIFVLICEELETIKKVLQLELLSKYHQKVIRNHGWMIRLHISDDTIMDHIIKNYRFRNLCFWSPVNVNLFVKELKNCHTLNLAGTNITDISVRELKKCHTLYLSSTNITDISVRELKHCHTLNLSSTKITDESVR